MALKNKGKQCTTPHPTGYSPYSQTLQQIDESEIRGTCYPADVFKINVYTCSKGLITWCSKQGVITMRPRLTYLFNLALHICSTRSHKHPTNVATISYGRFMLFLHWNIITTCAFHPKQGPQLTEPQLLYRPVLLTPGGCHATITASTTVVNNSLTRTFGITFAPW